jgi:transcriptional regulator with XRE-family HTH domain
MRDKSNDPAVYVRGVDEAHARLAARIRDLADERGLALSILADRAGVARGHFFAVLAGRSSPTVEWLVKIATVLEVDIQELFTVSR